MTVFLGCGPTEIELRASVDSDDGDVHGDFFRVLHEGDTFLGWDFSHFQSLGSGSHELEPNLMQERSGDG